MSKWGEIREVKAINRTWWRSKYNIAIKHWNNICKWHNRDSVVARRERGVYRYNTHLQNVWTVVYLTHCFTSNQFSHIPNNMHCFAPEQFSHIPNNIHCFAPEQFSHIPNNIHCFAPEQFSQPNTGPLQSPGSERHHQWQCSSDITTDVGSTSVITALNCMAPQSAAVGDLHSRLNPWQRECRGKNSKARKTTDSVKSLPITGSLCGWFADVSCFGRAHSPQQSLGLGCYHHFVHVH